MTDDRLTEHHDPFDVQPSTGATETNNEGLTVGSGLDEVVDGLMGQPDDDEFMGNLSQITTNYQIMSLYNSYVTEVLLGESNFRQV